MEKTAIYRTLEEAYFGEGRHEREILDLLPLVLRNASVFMDVGASLGQFTYFASTAMEGRIIAIEADPIRFERLVEKGAEWSKASGTKIECLHAAVSDHEGTIEFHTTNSNVSGGLFRHGLGHVREGEAPDVAWEVVKVPSVTLDAVCPQRDVDVVKIDVEGAELRVLKGARGILEEGRALLLIELHSFPDPEGQRNPDDVRSFLRSYRYKEYSLGEKSLFARDLWTRHRALWWRAAPASLIKRTRRILGRGLRFIAPQRRPEN